jgi:hypothetical protein
MVSARCQEEANHSPFSESGDSPRYIFEITFQRTMNSGGSNEVDELVATLEPHISCIHEQNMQTETPTQNFLSSRITKSPCS